MKCNTDGALMLKDNQVVCGEVIRDDSGSWQTRFSRNLGACSILMVKHWGILTILQVAWNKGFCRDSNYGAHFKRVSFK